ncbi:Iron transport multicopper oxidase FET3 [Gossypium arboreum]|uniref:Iron transport multicopper oxidase FET3 n=1 Tax=Gossypium arboreum TaxID=29729 RepID=A0A0B0Q201_GOSAR|nr:Iron transport multicopper oxidase FET3 [Gossypium arboreum]
MVPGRREKPSELAFIAHAPYVPPHTAVTTRSPTINPALMMAHWHADCGVRRGVAEYGVTIGILRRECFWKP